MSAPGRVDALVVGAGPAGCAAAWHLARRGIRVSLVDAHDFPRSKPCGDAVSPGALPLLEEMGLGEALAVAGAARIGGWRMRSRKGTWFRGRHRDDGSPAPKEGIGLPRAELDQLLLSAAVEAGARFLPRHRVFRLRVRDGRARGVVARGPDGTERELPARLVVGADGLRSRVARLLGPPVRGRRERLALVGRFQGANGPAGSRRPNDRPRFGELRFVPGGVVGRAPLGAGRWNVTAVVPAARAREISEDALGFYRSRLALADLGHMCDRELMGPLEVTGPFEVEPAATAAPGVLLAGDAAGYFDPLTGQGVYRALATGRLAAAAVARILARPERGTAERRRYKKALARFLRPSRRVQRLVDAIVFRSGGLELMARLLARQPGLTDLLVDVTGDRLPPAALVSPQRWLGALGGAGAAR